MDRRASFTARGGIPVRCSVCHAEAPAQSRYCGSCGCKLSPDEVSASAPRDNAVDQRESSAATESTGSCGSCGRPAPEGELCPSCQEAFAWVFTPADTPPSSPEVPDAAATPNESVAIVSESPDRIEMAGPATPVDAEPEGPGVEELEPSTSAEPALPRSGPIVPVRPPRISRGEALAVAMIAAFAIAGVAVGALWPHPPTSVQAVGHLAQAPSALADSPAAPAAAAAVPPVSETAAVGDLEPKSASTATAPARPRTSPPARKPRAPAKAAPPPQATPQPTAAVAPASASVEPPSAVASVPPVAPAPRDSVAVETPAGRFFEPSDVDEAPRVATRVEPALPGGLSGDHDTDVVVVRLLVSQSGHPFRVNLLRRSRLGAPADDAVIAAVKKWTFSPARKRGEAVACWFNVGVPLTAD